MILHIEKPKVSTKKLLELINEFSKVAGYKINIQKSAALQNTNNKLSGRESKKTFPFKITSKRIKYLGINLTKEVKDLYSETVKHWWRKLKMIQRNGKTSHIHRLEELILWKWLFYPKQSTDEMQSLWNYQWHFLQN